jgi:hypothetical protein
MNQHLNLESRPRLPTALCPSSPLWWTIKAIPLQPVLPQLHLALLPSHHNRPPRTGQRNLRGNSDSGHGRLFQYCTRSREMATGRVCGPTGPLSRRSMGHLTSTSPWSMGFCLQELVSPELGPSNAPKVIVTGRVATGPLRKLGER